MTIDISADAASTGSLRPSIQTWAVGTTPTATTTPVVPFRAQSLVPRDGFNLLGFPIDVPLGIKLPSLVSCEGLYLPDDVDPANIGFEGDYVRWLGDGDYYDGFNWNPVYNTVGDYTFSAGALTGPVLDDIDYRIGKKLYSFSSLRFSPGTYLTSNFNNGMDDAVNLTLIITGVVHGSEDSTIVRIGSSAANTIEVRNGGVMSVTNPLSKYRVTSTVSPTKMIPFYLVITISPTATTIALSEGIPRIYYAIFPSIDTGRNLSIEIGRGLDGVANLSMNVMDFVLLPTALADPKAFSVQAMTALSAAYGTN